MKHPKTFLDTKYIRISTLTLELYAMVKNKNKRKQLIGKITEEIKEST